MYHTDQNETMSQFCILGHPKNDTISYFRPPNYVFHISGHPHAGQRRSGARMPQPIAAILSILTILQYGENNDVIMRI